MQTNTAEITIALTDDQIPNIIFNETRSLSGDQIAVARKNITHSIINAQAQSGKRPQTGSTVAHVPKQENEIYAACVAAVKSSRDDRVNNIDSTSGATNFNFRKNNWKGDFYGLPIKSQIGPLNNSYPSADLPASNIYANTYGK